MQTTLARSLVLAALVAGGGCAPKHEVGAGADCVVEEGSVDSLRAVGEAVGIPVGTAVGLTPERRVQRYDRVLRQEFGSVTPEWTMKWAPLQPTPGAWDFEETDAIVDCALARGQRVKGHVLVWYRELPGWLPQEADGLGAAMDAHIRETVGHYRGKVVAWDVVNEVFGDDGALRDDLLTRTFGEAWIPRAFHAAHAADPDVPLFYNDYDVARLSPRSDAVLDLVRRLRADGVPVDGVGFQMHLEATVPVAPSELRERLRTFGELGVDVEITELDVRVAGLRRNPRYRDRVQALMVQEIAAACVDSGVCTGITVWGVGDAVSWVPREIGPDTPLLYDKRYRAKAARDALAAGLRGERPAVCEAVGPDGGSAVLGATGGEAQLSVEDGVAVTRVTARTEDWHGPSLTLLDAQGGGLLGEAPDVHRVKVSLGMAGVQDAAEPQSLEARVQLTARFKGGGEEAYVRLAQVDVVTGELSEVEAMLVVPGLPGALDEVVLYVEGAPVGLDVVAKGWEVAAYCPSA